MQLTLAAWIDSEDRSSRVTASDWQGRSEVYSILERIVSIYVRYVREVLYKSLHVTRLQYIKCEADIEVPPETRTCAYVVVVVVGRGRRRGRATAKLQKLRNIRHVLYRRQKS